jgi:hypothetical protein
VPRAQTQTPRLSSDFLDADLGDQRLNRRLGLLVDSLAERAAESFPKALNDAELEAAYRFFGNDQVTPDAILAPHFRQSARRAGELPRIFVPHASLAVSADGERRPLGLLALETVFRLKEPIGHKEWSPDQSLGESARWLRGVEAVEAQLDGRVEAIHVMDREADQYALLATLTGTNRSFVIRSFQDRRLAGEDEIRLREAARSAKVSLRREVPLSSRPHIKDPMGERHPARRHRVARLSFAAKRLDAKRTPDARTADQPPGRQR